MGEVVNVLVAFAVIVFVVRWATSGELRWVHPAGWRMTCIISGKDTSADGQSPAAILGFKPKTVTPEQVSSVALYVILSLCPNSFA